jgi:hypothetical protein
VVQFHFHPLRCYAVNSVKLYNLSINSVAPWGIHSTVHVLSTPLEILSPSSQELATKPQSWARWMPSTPSYPTPDNLEQYSGSSKISLPFRFSDQNFVYISNPYHICCIPHPSFPPLFDHPSTFVISKLFELWSSPLCSFVPTCCPTLHPLS